MSLCEAEDEEGGADVEEMIDMQFALELNMTMKSHRHYHVSSLMLLTLFSFKIGSSNLFNLVAQGDRFRPKVLAL